MMWLVAFISIIITCVVFKGWNNIYKNWRRNALYAKLPGKKAHFLLGHSLDFIGPRAELLKRFGSFIKDYQKEGIAKAWLGNTPTVLLFRAHSLEPLVSSQVNIEKSELYRFLHSWLGLGLLTSYGKKWQQRRKMLTPAFHFRILDDFVPIFNEQSEILVANLGKHVGEEYPDLYKYIALCTLDIICATAMGINLKAQTKPTSDYVQALSVLAEILNKRFYFIWYQNDTIFNLSPLGRQYKKALQIEHDFSRKIIEERKEEYRLKKSQIGKDNGEETENVYGRKRRVAFLDLLIEMSDDGKVLSDDDIQEEVDTFMFEGHDTTAAGIYWTLYLLGLNPNEQSKVHSELDNVLESPDCHITKEHLSDLKYLECAAKEAMRICPPVPFASRQVTQDLKIGDHIVPTGVSCVIFPYFLHRDEEYFPDPEKFDPERFLPENSKGRNPYAYLPFSAGPRNCIGQKFALMEEKIVLANILRKYKVTTESAVGCGADMRAPAELILRPTDEFKIKVELRDDH